MNRNRRVFPAVPRSRDVPGRNRSSSRLLAVAVAAVAAASACVALVTAPSQAAPPRASGGSAAPSGPSVAGVTPWKQQADPMAWSQGRVYYNQKIASGVFEGWSADPDGGNAVCITCGLYPAGTQHGISDVTADGRYALATSERSGHWPIATGAYVAAPGNGAYNDLYLQTTDGKQAWKLRDLPKVGANALIWARFNPSGTAVVWAEQWQFGVPFGAWRLHVAQLTWTGGVPALTDVKTLKTNGLVEPYGWTPDGNRILFASDALAGTSWNNLQIMSIDPGLTGTPARLSPRDAPETGYFTNYNEFAFPMPGTGRIIYGRSVGAFYYSMEYWTMNADGSDPQQLTSLSQPLSTMYRGYPSLANGLAFDPTNPKRFVAGFGTNYDGDYKSFLFTLR